MALSCPEKISCCLIFISVVLAVTSLQKTGFPGPLVALKGETETERTDSDLPLLYVIIPWTGFLSKLANCVVAVSACLCYADCAETCGIKTPIAVFAFISACAYIADVYFIIFWPDSWGWTKDDKVAVSNILAFMDFTLDTASFFVMICTKACCKNHSEKDSSFYA